MTMAGFSDGLSTGFRGLREQLVATIDTQLAQAAANGMQADDLGSPDELAARVGAAIPVARHPTMELVGRCYDTPGLTRWLGISKQALDKRNRAHTVLACRTEDGHWLYPALQFDDRGKPLPHLPELIQLLAGPDDTRRWRVARWLAAPNPDLPERMSAAQWLREGRDPEPILAAARADAQRWAA